MILLKTNTWVNYNYDSSVMCCGAFSRSKKDPENP